MSYACKARIDEKDQAHSGTPICVQVPSCAIARNVGVGRGSVSWILECSTVANLTWLLHDGMTDAELGAILYPSTARSASAQRPVPNWAEVHLELTKHRKLTLAQLWKEYIAAHPKGTNTVAIAIYIAVGGPLMWIR